MSIKSFGVKLIFDISNELSSNSIKYVKKKFMFEYEKNNTDFCDYNSFIKLTIHFWLSRRANESIRVFVKNTWKYDYPHNLNYITK